MVFVLVRYLSLFMYETVVWPDVSSQNYRAIPKLLSLNKMLFFCLHLT